MSSLITRILSVACLASVIALGACASNKTSSNAADKPEPRIAVINSVCPVAGDDFDTKERTEDLVRTVNGQKIGFCCEHCVVKFDKMSEEKKTEILAAATANKQM